jgi:hypothetical protein
MLTHALVGFLVGVLGTIWVCCAIGRSGWKHRRQQDLYWWGIAEGIRAKDPSADVMWCFSPGRPPYRNPPAPFTAEPDPVETFTSLAPFTYGQRGNGL